MRHLRTLGVTVVAVVAVSAVAAMPALAAKNPYSDFSYCPVNYANAEGVHTESCIWAQSNSESYFKAGKVRVNLTKPITLQGGLIENPETGHKTWIGAEPGSNSTLKPVTQTGPSITEIINPELLPPAEKARFEQLVAAGKTASTATIELAGEPDTINLREGNLIEASNETALGLPVQVKLGGPFLGKTCSVGSNSDPIEISLVTGTSGTLTGEVGQLHFTNGGTILKITGDRLVNDAYVAPAAVGCGVDGAATAAVNAGIGLPAGEGENETVIAGTLGEANAINTKAELGK